MVDAAAAPDTLAEAIRRGDRRALARAVTLVESTRADHRAAADQLIAALLPFTGRSVRVGVSGVPGVGKSTFIEALGLFLTARDHRVAVLAIDPSSRRTGGSILGDKTRMEALARDPAAFIRPSPTAGTLGGVARRTREAMVLTEAAGFDIILVETVGVGQSETAVADMVDLFLLLLPPAGGDELQGIKKGIVELADLIVVNKADGDLSAAARRAVADYRHALALLRPRRPNWQVPVLSCSAIGGVGIAEVWQAIERFHATLSATGELETQRAEQAETWMWNEVHAELVALLDGDPLVRQSLAELRAEVRAGRLSAGAAAKQLTIALKK